LFLYSVRFRTESAPSRPLGSIYGLIGHIVPSARRWCCRRMGQVMKRIAGELSGLLFLRYPELTASRRSTLLLRRSPLGRIRNRYGLLLRTSGLDFGAH